jgi:hypothetical protein
MSTTYNPPDLLDVLAAPLMRAEEVADLLSVPVSTVYELSRRRRDPLRAAGATGWLTLNPAAPAARDRADGRRRRASASPSRDHAR